MTASIVDRAVQSLIAENGTNKMGALKALRTTAVRLAMSVDDVADAVVRCAALHGASGGSPPSAPAPRPRRMPWAREMYDGRSYAEILGAGHAAVRQLELQGGDCTAMARFDRALLSEHVPDEPAVDAPCRRCGDPWPCEYISAVLAPG